MRFHIGIRLSVDVSGETFDHRVIEMGLLDAIEEALGGVPEELFGYLSHRTEKKFTLTVQPDEVYAH